MKKIFKLFTIACCLMPIACSAQFDFIGRKINSNQPKPIPSSQFKSGKGIPSLDFTFDSIRPLNELKSGNGEIYPWLSPDGNRVYYTEAGSHWQIFIAEKKLGNFKFSNPHLLNINVDTSSDYLSAWLTNDELNIYFVQLTKNGTNYLCHSSRDSINHDFSIPVHVKLIGKNIINLNGPSFTQDLQTLYMSLSDNTSKNANICIFNKTDDDVYTLKDTLNIPNSTLTGEGMFTTDDLNYFLNFGTAQTYVRLYLMKRDSIKEKLTKLYYINNPYINDTNYEFIDSPYYSKSNNTLAFSKCDSGYVFSNFELYFAYNFRQIDNIKENKNISNYIKIFPNPTDNYIEIISTNFQLSLDYFLTNLTGQTIKSGTFRNDIKLDLSPFSKCVYILSVIDKNKNQKAYYKIMKL